MSDPSSLPSQFANLLLHSRSIVLDQQAQIRRFLDQYHLETHHFFSRHEDSVVVFADAETSYADYFRLLWPGLPSIKVGSFQIPLGFSRYSRALFALDRESFLALAHDAWGWSPENPNDVASITDAPGLWGTENAILRLELRDADVVGPAGSSPIRFEMYVLPPMRISADSLDLIALPLVDVRWFWQHTYPTTQPSIESWTAFFETLRFQLPGHSSLGAYSFPDNFLELTCETLPDISLQTTTVPIVRLLDAAAHTLGMRGFLNNREGSNPRWGFAYPPVSMQKFYQLVKDADFKVAGGKSGSAANYGYLKIHGRRVTDGTELNRRESAVSTHALPDGANSIFTRSLYSTYKVDPNNSEEATYFENVSQWIAKTRNECKGDGVYITFGGPGLLFEDFDALCGLDYIEQVFDHEGKATWISHFVDLPSGWQPQAILLQPSRPTTTTITSPIQGSPCSGKCSWVSNDGFKWDLVNNNCAPATTTTTTSSGGPTTTTTTLPPTCPRRPTTTTTTANPNACSCLPPQFCPIAAGDCTETSCAREVGSVTQCNNTTTTTTTGSPTTTTCDCNTTTTTTARPGCGGGCTWIMLGNGQVILLQSDCAPECPCSYPGGANLCQTVTCPCQIPPPPPPPPPPVPRSDRSFTRSRR